MQPGMNLRKDHSMSSFRHSRTLRRHARRIGAVLAAALSAVAFTACTPASPIRR